jgi:hypothetical protein
VPLRELLTNYCGIAEVFFDDAKGENAKIKSMILMKV